MAKYIDIKNSVRHDCTPLEISKNINFITQPSLINFAKVTSHYYIIEINLKKSLKRGDFIYLRSVSGRTSVYEIVENYGFTVLPPTVEVYGYPAVNEVVAEIVPDNYVVKHTIKIAFCGYLNLDNSTIEAIKGYGEYE